MTRGLLRVVACSLIALGARAQGELVRVQIAACSEAGPGWDTQQMLEIVRVEIAPRQLVLSDAEPDALRIDACDPNRLVLRDARGPKPVQREMPLDDVPAQLKPRVAALAVAELATGAPPEAGSASAALSSPPPPTGIRPRKPTPIEAELLSKEQEKPKHTQNWLGLGAEGRVFFAEPGPSFGPRLTLALRHVELSAVALLGKQVVPAGDVSTGIAAGALEVPFWRVKGAPDVSIAAGGEVGATWAKGTLREGEAAQTRGEKTVPFFSGLMRLNWGGRVAKTAYAQVAWSLGYARGLNARAQGRVAASTHGPFAAMTATIAWVP